MQISNISTQAYTSTAPSTRRAQDAYRTAAASDSVNLEQSKSLTAIAAKYDVKNISPRQMVDLAKDLHQAGAISNDDYWTLSFQPELGYLPEGMKWAMGGPDTPRDFQAQWQSALKFDQSIHNAANIAGDRRIVNLLGNLAALREPVANR